MPQEKLFTLEEALSLDARVNFANHEKYVNPGLARMMSLLAFDRPFARAEGMYVWDQEGNRYLDFLGGYGSLNLGHNHPAVAAAVEAVGDMPNLLQAALNPLAGALAHNLAQITPGDLCHTFLLQQRRRGGGRGAENGPDRHREDQDHLLRRCLSMVRAWEPWRLRGAKNTSRVLLPWYRDVRVFPTAIWLPWRKGWLPAMWLPL
jgi:hypothetical protein